MMRTLLTLAAALALAAPAAAALKPGDKAPLFTTAGYLAGNPINLSLQAALAKGPVVLYFFPAAHTSGCNLEARMFSEAIDSFRKEGASVIGITAGNINELADFSKENEHCGGKFPVAADPGAKIAKQYDSVLALKPDWSERTSYVIGKDGRIVSVYSDLSAKDHVNQMLTAVRAMKRK